MVVVPRKDEDCKRDYYAECRRLAELAFERYCGNIWEPLYLAGTKRCGLDTLNPRSEIWASLDVATELYIHNSAVLMTVDGRALPRHMTVDQLADYIQDLLRSVPLWIFAD